jgi:hypothetical protein
MKKIQSVLIILFISIIGLQNSIVAKYKNINKNNEIHATNKNKPNKKLKSKKKQTSSNVRIQNRGNINRNRRGTNNHKTAAVGAAAVHNTNQQQQKAAVGAAALHSNNQQQQQQSLVQSLIQTAFCKNNPTNSQCTGTNTTV